MTSIEWTDESWNPIRARLRSDPTVIGWHCEHASPGCEHCYSETRNRSGRCNMGTKLPYKPGHRKDVEIYIDEAQLLKPLSWRKGRKVFVCSMTDLFADFVTDEMLDRIFAVMALCPQHTFQVLTKRSDRMREYFRETTGWRTRIAELLNELKPSPLWNGNVYQGWQNLHGRPDGLPNVWLGVSVEDQQRADERIPDLLATPAAVRWISAEPLLGPINIIDAMWARDGFSNIHAAIDWVVCGGESGAMARPMRPDWAQNLRDQCKESGTPFFFKQWGEWGWSEHDARLVLCGKKRAGRLLDGVEHNGMPGRA